MENINNKEVLSNKSKHEFFTILSQIIGYTPIDIVEGDEKITLLSDNGKLKVIYKEQERIVDFDKYVDEYGNSLFNDFNAGKLEIITHIKLE